MNYCKARDATKGGLWTSGVGLNRTRINVSTVTSTTQGSGSHYFLASRVLVKSARIGYLCTFLDRSNHPIPLPRTHVHRHLPLN